VYGKGVYIKRQFGIATQVSVIKVTVAKNRNSVSAQKLEFAQAY